VIAGARLQLPDDLLNGLALFVEPSGQRPFPPTPLTAEIVGDTVTIRWGSAPLGSSATSFVLEAGSGRGLSNIASITVTGSSYTASGVPAGTYYVRVRAVTALGTSAPTDDLAITVGSASCTAPPQSPAVTYAEAEADGQVLVFWFGWSGSAPTSFVLEAGSGPGLANLATIELTSLPPVTFNNVPAGVYYLRVRSRNACGTSAPSPDFALSVGSAPTPPLAPFGLTATVSGGTVTLQWLAPSLSTVTSYLLEAGTTQGATDIAVMPLSGTSFSTGGVPSGVYFVRVRAVNSVGVSPPSSEFILVVP
jgi:predicted phage tail protein